MMKKSRKPILLTALLLALAMLAAAVIPAVYAAWREGDEPRVEIVLSGISEGGAVVQTKEWATVSVSVNGRAATISPGEAMVIARDGEAGVMVETRPIQREGVDSSLMMEAAMNPEVAPRLTEDIGGELSMQNASVAEGDAVPGLVQAQADAQIQAAEGCVTFVNGAAGGNGAIQNNGFANNSSILNGGKLYIGGDTIHQNITFQNISAEDAGALYDSSLGAISFDSLDLINTNSTVRLQNEALNITKDLGTTLMGNGNVNTIANRQDGVTISLGMSTDLTIRRGPTVNNVIISSSAAGSSMTVEGGVDVSLLVNGAGEVKLENNGNVGNIIATGQGGNLQVSGSGKVGGAFFVTDGSGEEGGEEPGRQEKQTHVHDLVRHQGQAATCTEDGWDYYQTCNNCYYTTYRTIEALGHDWDGWQQTKAPTCTEAGEEKRTCQRQGCGATETREVAPDENAHPKTAIVEDDAVPVTCLEDGLTAGSHCSACKAVIVAQTVIEAPGSHDWGGWEQTTAPTCTEAGEEKRTCQRPGCGAAETRGVEPDGHDWGEAEHTVLPSCKAKGLNTYTCRRQGCGETKTEEVDEDPNYHLPANVVTDAAVPATCTATGLTAGSHCSACNAVITAQETIPALTHDWGDWEQTTAPTCTEAGEEKRTCQRQGCGAAETREVEPDENAHPETAIVEDEEVPATCLEDGLTAGSHCSACKAVIVAQTVIEAPGSHDWGDWEQTTAPTCTEAGEEKRTCQRQGCGATETREVEPDGHDWGDWEETTAPTCTEKGEETRTCNRNGCEATETREVEPDGHDWGDWEETTAPTCTEKGEETRTCQRQGCGATETREVEPDGHDWGEAEHTVLPSCKAKGLNTYTCRRQGCGETKTEEVDEDPNYHLPANVVTDAAVPATCTATGLTEGKHCSACNAVIEAQQVTDALGHTGGTATCLAKAVCTRCEKEYGELGEHQYKIVEEGKKATCTEPGFTPFYHCPVCGDDKPSEEIPALGGSHVYEDGVCTICGAPQPMNTSEG